MALRIEQHRDDAHGLLRVVAAMAERVERGRGELQDTEGADDSERRRARRGPGHDPRPKPWQARTPPAVTARSQPVSSRARFQTAAERPALAMPAPTRPPINACELEDGMPSAQVIRFHTITPTSAAKITAAWMNQGLDDPRADGVGNVKPEHRKRDEIEERGPGHRIFRAQHPRRHDGRYRVRGIVQAVEEVEQQRNTDQDGEPREAQCGIHCPTPVRLRSTVISLATSSKRSATFSR